MAPKKKASEPAASEPPAKKAKKGLTWEWLDGSEWKEFDPKDVLLLEDRYRTLGAKAKFTTKGFTFNKGFGSVYELNYETMTQVNHDTGKTREIRRSDSSSVSTTAQWEWWADAGKWQLYKTEDQELLEKAYASGTTPFMTKKLSFNAGYDSLYIFDFTVMTQLNMDSGTSRKIQRTPIGGSKVGGHSKIEDDAFADTFLSGISTASTSGSAVGFKFELGLSPAIVKAQKSKGEQSLRKQKKDYGPAIKKSKHASKCFDDMLKNEKEFCGEWVVFYHSYSCAAILYEVQAAVASVLFRFKAEFAGLPRILAHGFKKIPDAKAMLKLFPTWKDEDHNPAFKAVGLCGTSSLLADDSEAPAKSVFLAGYSIGSLAGVLEKLLLNCGVPKAACAKLAKDILALAVKNGLDTLGHPGGKKCKSGRSGHMLQIFLRRELCDKFVYPAFPFGVPDKSRDLPFSKYLAEKAPIEGQVRITLHPDVFLRATYARMFSYSADPDYHANRPAFIKALVGLLTPILGDDKVRTKAAIGIFGGKLPDWWSAGDQSEKAAMPASRYKSSSMAE